MKKISLLSLLLFLISGATAQTPLTPQESRGKQIYLSGTSKPGKDILAYIGDSSLEVPGSTMACANCHGMTGQGKPEGGIDPSNITWEALTKPYGVTHNSGRKHPAYTARALELAITRGLDPAGNKLLYAMPRYQMSQEDLADLVVYLKRLGTDTDPGITDDKILIGTALPMSGPLAEAGQAVKDTIAAYFTEVNLQGGVYNRRLELKFVETGDTPAATRANIERLIKDENLFAMTGVFMPRAEKEVAPMLAQWEVPVVGPLIVEPYIGTPLNRQVFYLLAGNTMQARALVSFAAKKAGGQSGSMAVLYHNTDLNLAVVDAIKAESKKVSVYEYQESDFDAAEYVKQMRQEPPARVFFIGSVGNLLSFMREAEKVNWFPDVLLQSGRMSEEIYNAPPGFEGKIFFALPRSPADNTAEGVREFLAFEEKYKLPTKDAGYNVLAYCGAKILVEALKRVGKNLSRENLIQTLEGFYQYPTGLIPVITYGPNRRVGAMGAYIVTVDFKKKKFVPASGWIGIE